MEFQNGFTLVEVLVAVLVFALISYGLIEMIANTLTISSQQDNLVADVNQTRKLEFSLINQLRNAQSGSNGAYPLDTAQSQQIVFYSTIGGSSAIDRIRYYLQNGKLYQGITAYNGSAYNTSTEQTTIMQSDVANGGGTPVFLYYDGTYTGSATQTPLSQPVNLTAVRFVQISLEVLQKAGVSDKNYYTVTAGGAIRNLKTNLGQ